MPQAVYLGSAPSYNIGPHKFTPTDAEKTVSDEIAKVLGANPEFSIDGKAGAAAVGADGEVERALIPAGGFPNRSAAATFAAKWLPGLELNMDRSTAELTRVIEAALDGLTLDADGETVVPAKGKKPPAKPSKAVPV